MSLNALQRQATSRELNANFEISGLSAEELARRVGVTPNQATDALQVENSDPRTVWHVRDALEQAVREAGKDPVPYSVLTEQARSAAEGWFGI